MTEHNRTQRNTTEHNGTQRNTTEHNIKITLRDINIALHHIAYVHTLVCGQDPIDNFADVNRTVGALLHMLQAFGDQSWIQRHGPLRQSEKPYVQKHLVALQAGHAGRGPMRVQVDWTPFFVAGGFEFTFLCIPLLKHKPWAPKAKRLQ